MEQKKKAKIVIASIWGKLLVILGWVFAIFWGLIILGALIDDKKYEMSFYVFCLLLLIIAIIMIRAGRKINKRIKLFKQYVVILSTDPTHSLTQLASSTGQSVDQVIQNVSLMIKKKYFADAYIDKDGNYIIFGQHNPPQNAAPSFSAPAEAKPEYIVVTCKGCGATNHIIKGSVSECEYCGSKL